MEFDLHDLESKIDGLASTLDYLKQDSTLHQKKRCEKLEEINGMLTLEVEKLRGAIQASRIWLVGALDHPYGSCHPQQTFKCFLCEAIGALLKATHESSP